MDEKVETMLEVPAYRLSEDAYTHLVELRDRLLLMATLAFAATTEEDESPLEIRRGALGKCFERKALEIESLLAGLTRLQKSVDKMKSN